MTKEQELERLFVDVIGRNFENIHSYTFDFTASVQKFDVNSTTDTVLNDPIAAPLNDVGDRNSNAVLRFCVSIGAVSRWLKVKDDLRIQQQVLAIGISAKTALVSATHCGYPGTAYTIHSVKLMQNHNGYEILFTADNSKTKGGFVSINERTIRPATKLELALR